MVVPEGKTLYIGKRKFKEGEKIPPDLEGIAGANLNHTPPPTPPDPPQEE